MILGYQSYENIEDCHDRRRVQQSHACPFYGQLNDLRYINVEIAGVTPRWGVITEIKKAGPLFTVRTSAGDIRVPFGHRISRPIFVKHLDDAMQRVSNMLKSIEELLSFTTFPVDESYVAHGNRLLYSIAYATMDDAVVFQSELLGLCNEVDIVYNMVRYHPSYKKST